MMWAVIYLNEKEFAMRIINLREQKGVSARDMSLSIGQNPGYINNIETGKALPSLTGFFYICDYFGITPAVFFDDSTNDPIIIDRIVDNLKKLNRNQLEHVEAIIKDIIG